MEIRSQTGRSPPRNMFMWPTQYFKNSWLNCQHFRMGKSLLKLQMPIPCSPEKVKTLAPLRSSCCQAELKGGPCCPIHASPTRESECPSWYFLPHPINEPNNEAHPGQRCFLLFLSRAKLRPIKALIRHWSLTILKRKNNKVNFCFLLNVMARSNLAFF